MSLVDPLILGVGAGGIGVVLGWYLGVKMAKNAGLNPSASVLRGALKDAQDNYKVMLGRANSRLKEYEQPSELQRFAQNTQGVAPDNIIEMLSNELPNIKGLPRWLRPMIPGIQAYLKDNPEQVTELVAKFMSKAKPQEGSMDYL